MFPTLRKWHQENRAAFLEIIVILTATVLLYVAATYLAFAQNFYEWSRKHTEIGPLIVVSMFLALAFAFFSLRRWLELRRRIWLADTDGLTGLSNKRRFIEILETEMSRFRRHGRPLSVIMFDIDLFKRVNDEFGHSAGDEVLKAIADLISKELRDLDSLARWGGDEFVIITTETELEGACRLAERLRRTLADAALPRPIQVTSSFGVCQALPNEDVDHLIRRVDRLLYQAKEAGRNLVQSERIREELLAPPAEGVRRLGRNP